MHIYNVVHGMVLCNNNNNIGYRYRAYDVFHGTMCNKFGVYHGMNFILHDKHDGDGDCDHDNNDDGSTNVSISYRVHQHDTINAAVNFNCL